MTMVHSCTSSFLAILLRSVFFAGTQKRGSFEEPQFENNHAGLQIKRFHHALKLKIIELQK